MHVFNNLSLLIGTPEAAAAAGGPASMAPTLITFGLVFAIFYFLIIRPQNKQRKETESMLKALKKGDRVVTIGGIRGTIVSIKDDTVLLKVDDAAKILFSRSAISGLVDKTAASSAKSSGKKAAAEITDNDSDDEAETDASTKSE